MPKNFGLLAFFYYLCTYESQQLPLSARYLPSIGSGLSAFRDGGHEPEAEISWGEVLHLALYPSG